MSLKITAGKFKGKKIISPKEIARPTSSMMRQALFNIISGQIEDAKFLDLFAGSGVIGIEALSRGAEQVVFVEINKKNTDSIQKSLTMLNVKDKAKVICKDVINAISQIGLTFDLVFMDPPYSQSHPLIISALNALDVAKIIEDKAHIFIETDSKFPIDSIEIKNFILVKSKKYGNSALHQYQYFLNK